MDGFINIRSIAHYPTRLSVLCQGLTPFRQARTHLPDIELGRDGNKIVVDMLNANWRQEGIEKNYRLKPYKGNPYVRNFRGGDGNGVWLR